MGGETTDPYKIPTPRHRVRGAGFSTPPPKIMPDLTVPHHFATNVPVGVQTLTGGIFMLRRRHGILPPAQVLACIRSRISTASSK